MIFLLLFFYGQGKKAFFLEKMVFSLQQKSLKNSTYELCFETKRQSLKSLQAAHKLSNFSWFMNAELF